MLDWINTDEFLSLVVLIGLLVFIGQQFTSMNSREALYAKRTAGTTFLLYAAAGIYSWGVFTVTEAIVVILRASLASGVVYGLSLILLTPAAIALKHLKPKPALPQPMPLPPPSLPPRARSAKEIAREAEAEERQRREQEEQVSKARERAANYYKQNPAIHDDYPPELFETRLEARFKSVSHIEALAAAEELIQGMKPFIDKAREREGAAKEEELGREKQAATEEEKRKEKEDRLNAIERITEWYHTEKAKLEHSYANADPQERKAILDQLFDRYDELVKRALEEINP